MASFIKLFVFFECAYRLVLSYRSISIGNAGKYIFAEEDPVFCRLLDRLYRLREKVTNPIPNRVLVFYSANSTYSPILDQIRTNAECRKWTENGHYWLHNTNQVFLSVIPIDSEQDLLDIEWNVQLELSGTLLIAECSEEIDLGFADCRRFFRLLARLNMYQHVVNKRLFSLLFIYQNKKQESLSRKIVTTFLLEPELAKMHSAVVVFEMNAGAKKPRLFFTRVSFVRPLKNVCFIDGDYLEDHKLDEMIITRHLLAIDHHNRTLQCNFHHSLLRIGSHQVCLIICSFYSTKSSVFLEFVLPIQAWSR